MKEVLIMGGTTFVSSSLAQYLIYRGYTVDILTRGLKVVEYNGFRKHLVCDRKSEVEIKEVLKGKKYEFIFDISAYTKDDVEILLNSVDKSQLKKYIFCSTGAVYKFSNEIVNEDFERGENANWGKYGLDKKEAEDFIISSNTPYIIFRPTYIYGENNNLYREAYFFDMIRNNKVIPIPFRSKSNAQFIHIEDLVKVFESVIENENICKVYNVTNPDFISWEVFLSTCAEVVGKVPIIKKIDVNKAQLDSRAYFPFRDITCTLDISRLLEDNLFVPRTSLINGLTTTYKWYLESELNITDLKMMEGINKLTKL